MAACIASWLVCPVASADLSEWWNSTTPYSDTGIYAGIAGSLALGIGLENHIVVTRFRDQIGRNLEHDLEVEPGAGVHARAGYRFHPRLAVETQFEWISEWSIDGRDTERTNPTSSAQVARAEAWTLTLNGKFFASTGRVQPYGVFGVGMMRFQGDNKSPLIPGNSRPIFELNTDGVRRTDFALRVGGGLDIYFTDDLSLVVGTSYVIPYGQVDPYDYLSFEWGLQYRF
jgi:opacity protein-like surface antigen